MKYVCAVGVLALLILLSGAAAAQGAGPELSNMSEAQWRGYLLAKIEAIEHNVEHIRQDTRSVTASKADKNDLVRLEGRVERNSDALRGVAMVASRNAAFAGIGATIGTGGVLVIVTAFLRRRNRRNG